MVDDFSDILSHGGAIVIGNADPYFAEALGRLESPMPIVDLVRIEKRGPLSWHLLVTTDAF